MPPNKPYLYLVVDNSELPAKELRKADRKADNKFPYPGKDPDEIRALLFKQYGSDSSEVEMFDTLRTNIIALRRGAFDDDPVEEARRRVEVARCKLGLGPVGEAVVSFYLPWKKI